MGILRFGPYTIEISNREKVLFPCAGLTKGDLIDYYRDIAGTLLPYLKDRPVVMHRFPDGIDKDGFYHKDTPGFFPDWIRTKTVRKEQDGRVRHVLCQNTAALVYLANQGCVTPHVWLSRADRLQHPDQLVFDLDPASQDFAPLRRAARRLRDLLVELGLTPFLKTSGSRGLHVMVPLDRRTRFDESRCFAQGIARVLAARHPQTLTVEARRKKRRGRLYLDTGRNAYAQTVAPPYSVRPRPNGPVSTPLNWDELGNSCLHPAKYTIRSIFRRLSRKDDPWRSWHRHRCGLRQASQRLNRLLESETH